MNRVIRIIFCNIGFYVLVFQLYTFCLCFLNPFILYELKFTSLGVPEEWLCILKTPVRPITSMPNKNGVENLPQTADKPLAKSQRFVNGKSNSVSFAMLKEPTPRQHIFEMMTPEDLIPRDHLLRKLDKFVDFEFICDKVRISTAATTAALP
jgi:hypothetical protein